VNRAVFPGYAKQARDLEQLRTSFAQVTSVLWLIALPAGTGVALTAPLLVPVVLGPNWLEATPLLTVLAIFGTLMVMQANIGYVYYALGSPRTTTSLTFAYVLLQLPLMIGLTFTYGAIGAAWAQLLTAIVFVPTTLGLILRRLGLHARRFASGVWRTVVAVGLMALAVRGVMAYAAAAAWPQAASLVAAVLTGVTTYVAAVAVLWLLARRPPGAERLLVERLGHKKRSQPHD
jgi:O-antigen/teichoic acid export membrane protein